MQHLKAQILKTITFSGNHGGTFRGSSMHQSVQKTLDTSLKLSVSCVYANFSHFYLGILFENFLSLQVSIETLKNVFTIVWQ